MQAPVINVLIQLMLSQARDCLLQRLLRNDSPEAATDQTDDLLRSVELAQDCATVCFPSFSAIISFLKNNFIYGTCVRVLADTGDRSERHSVLFCSLGLLLVWPTMYFLRMHISHKLDVIR